MTPYLYGQEMVFPSQVFFGPTHQDEIRAQLGFQLNSQGRINVGQLSYSPLPHVSLSALGMYNKINRQYGAEVGYYILPKDSTLHHSMDVGAMIQYKVADYGQFSIKGTYYSAHLAINRRYHWLGVKGVARLNIMDVVRLDTKSLFSSMPYQEAIDGHDPFVIPEIGIGLEIGSGKIKGVFSGSMFLSETSILINNNVNLNFGLSVSLF